MNILTMSIMHTGAHLLVGHILKDFEHLLIKPPQKVGQNKFQSNLHTVLDNVALLDQMLPQADYVIAPMRHPVRVNASFKARTRRLSRLMEQFLVLDRYMNKANILFLHIDDFENRDNQLKEIGNKIGIELTCDWPLNTSSGSVHSNHNLVITQEGLNEIPSWIMDIYDKTKLADVSYRELPSQHGVALLG